MEEFKEGNSVYVRNFSAHGEKWIQGVIIELCSVNFRIKEEDQSIVKRHVDQLKKPVEISY